ncbi:MAG: heat-inducible transcriptional repressor HrcA [Anaerolineae bacterium]
MVVREPVEELNERQQDILAIVVQEYTATVTPVGSQNIAEQYDLGVSSATIRNEMASLEESGYLTHPHPSAGRVPTDKGYRYFVERLLGEVELSPSEKRTILHQFHQVYLDLGQWMRLAAAVLANSAQSAALVTTPKAIYCRYKHLELLSTSETMILMILILQEGTVKQQMLVNPQPPLSQEDLNRSANKLNDLLEGCTARGIGRRVLSLTAFEQQVAEQVVELMKRVDRGTNGEICRDGLIHIFRQPEFAEADKIEQVVQGMEQRFILDELLAETIASSGVQVFIGGEGRWQEISDLSLILSRYGVTELACGVLGVWGPMRMPYGRAISTVRYVANLMDDLVSQFFGYEP